MSRLEADDITGTLDKMLQYYGSQKRRVKIEIDQIPPSSLWLWIGVEKVGWANLDQALARVSGEALGVSHSVGWIRDHAQQICDELEA